MREFVDALGLFPAYSTAILQPARGRPRVTVASKPMIGAWMPAPGEAARP